MAKAGQGLTQQQQQQLRLNMRQMYLGRLLEMSTPEFEEEIVKALEENPALTTLDSDADMTPDFDDDNRDTEDYGDDEIPYTNTPRKDYIFTQASENGSEADLIEQQLSEFNLTDVELEVAHYVIGNLDSSGYLTRSKLAIADDLAMTAGIDVSTETVAKMVRIIKSLDPAGIGAENLRECLLLQLQRMPSTPVVNLAREILTRHYKSFINNRPDLLKEAMDVDDDEFEAALKLIRSLNPKPGAGLFDLTDARTRHISPDFIMEIDDDGRLNVSLAGSIPDLGIDEAFSLDDIRNLDPKSIDFIRERHNGAQDFIDAVKRRGSTLMKIMKAIIALQPEFFQSFDFSDLRPMVLRDVETATGFDKSVVSRSTSTKYMLTPEGIIPLKALFGEAASATSHTGPREVEEAIRKLVEEEDKAKPLSDDDLTALLNEKGMALARRTVAKYRERLGIPIARLRRR